MCFAAIGAGLIHLSLAIGAPIFVAVALGSLGFAQFAWGAVTFAQPRIRAPRVTFAAAMTPVIAWAVTLIVSGLFDSTQLARSLPLVPLAIAALLELVAAALVAAQLRRDRSVSSAPEPGALPRASALSPLPRAIAGVAVAAVVLSALTLVALAGTPAGLRGLPAPGSTVPLFDPPGQSGH